MWTDLSPGKSVARIGFILVLFAFLELFNEKKILNAH